MSRVWKLGGIAVLATLVAAPIASAAPYGTTGTIGPTGATVRSCTGMPNCVVLGPTDAWQTAITNMAAGGTVLLRGGSYTPSGSSVSMAPGTAASPTTLANFNGELPILTRSLSLRGNNVVEGVTVNVFDRNSAALFAEALTATVLENVTLRNVSLQGGTGDGVRFKGNLRNITVRNSLIDGGRANHGMLVECELNTVPCSFAPDNILLENNRFSKTNFPGITSEDLLQLEGHGNVTVKNNSFGQNLSGEQCIDVKRSGRVGAITNILFNELDARTGSGCRIGPMLITQSVAGSMLIEGNHFFDGSTDFRSTPTGARVQNNWFEGVGGNEAEIVFSPGANMTFGFNTMAGPGNVMTFGDSGGPAPSTLVVTNNVFQDTAFRGTSWNGTRGFNVLDGTTGSTLGSCPTCISGDAALGGANGYEIAQGSVAINAAGGTFTVATDIEGTTRPQGSASDIGTFEFAGDEPPPEVDQVPFADNLVPGTVQAENFDVMSDASNGEGITYHDTTSANTLGQYRSEGVDIKAAPGGFAVGLMATGEWLEYTIDVQQAGQHHVLMQYAQGDTSNPQVTFSIDGAPFATINPANTGGWTTQRLMAVGEVTLAAGEHLLRVDINAQWVDIDFFDIQSGPLPPDEDVIAPTAEITAPADGATVQRNKNVTVRWTAQDDPGGDGVETSVLTINGQVRATRSGEGAFSFVWRTPSARQQNTLSVTATDFAGNAATDTVVVTTR